MNEAAGYPVVVADNGLAVGDASPITLTGARIFCVEDSARQAKTASSRPSQSAELCPSESSNVVSPEH